MHRVAEQKEEEGDKDEEQAEDPGQTSATVKCKELTHKLNTVCASNSIY